MNEISRRSFMKGLAGVVAGVSALSKAEEPKEPQPKKPQLQVEYDLIADLVEEIKGFHKKVPDTFIKYSIHCNYTGLAFLNDMGNLDKYEYVVDAVEKGYTHYLLIPYEFYDKREAYKCAVWINVMLRPNLTQEIGLIAQYSTRRNILNKLENVWTLVTTRCFNVNRDEEGRAIANEQVVAYKCGDRCSLSRTYKTQGLLQVNGRIS